MATPYNHSLSMPRRWAPPVELTRLTPLGSAREYTPPSLVERIDYAEARMNSTTRIPTPNIAKKLLRYQIACMDLHLDNEDLDQEELAQGPRR